MAGKKFDVGHEVLETLGADRAAAHKEGRAQHLEAPGQEWEWLCLDRGGNISSRLSRLNVNVHAQARLTLPRISTHLTTQCGRDLQQFGRTAAQPPSARPPRSRSAQRSAARPASHTYQLTYLLSYVLPHLLT